MEKQLKAVLRWLREVARGELAANAPHHRALVPALIYISAKADC